jgi:hypothetical protein
MSKQTCLLPLFIAVATLLTLGCGSSHKAEKSLDKQLDEAFDLKDYAARANRLCALAGKLGEAKEFSERERALKGAQASAELVQDPQLKAGVLIRTATELARAEQPREARDLLDKAKEAAQKLEDPSAKAGVIARAAVALGELPNTGDAVTKYCQEALAIIDTLKEPLDKVKQLAAVAPAAAKASEANLADECLAKARELEEQLADGAKQAIAEGEIAAALHKMGREEDSAKAFTAAGEKAATVDDPFLRANAQITLCKMLNSAKQTAEAKEMLATAEKSMKKIKSSSDQEMVKQEFDKLQKKL